MRNFLGVLFIFMAINAYSSTNYNECILENMKGVSSDVAAEAIKKTCRELFDSKWESYTTVTYTSPITNNNDNRRHQSGCDHASPDGKYCADEVRIYGVLKEDADYKYRFEEGQGCPVSVASGPNGWMKVISCSINTGGTEFTARVMGWTKPQTFKANLKVERKKI